MWRALTVMGLAAAVGGVFLVPFWSGGGAAVLAGPPSGGSKASEGVAAEWVKNNPKGKTEAAEKPQVKDNRCPKIKPEEREAIGLPAPTWVSNKEKAQPAVREALEAQEKLIRGNPMAEFQGDRPSGFQGMVYVDIYLRHKAKGAFDSKENQAAVKEVEDRLLSRLTAAEFSTCFALENTAGVVGYVNDAGLKKLIDDPDVVGVGVDDQARPAYGNVECPDEMERQGPIEKIGKVDVFVYTELERSGEQYVRVVVDFDKAASKGRGYEERDALLRELQSRVLSAIPAQGFRLASGTGGLTFMTGYANRAGLLKLDKHADVRRVSLDCASGRGL